MSGSQIAAEVAAALAEAGEATGNGPLICTIGRNTGTGTPWDNNVNTVPDLLYPVTGIENMQDVRDMSGMLVGIQKRTLTINATGVSPLKSDTIAVGVAPDDVVEGTKFEEIISVMYLSPGGTVLFYRLELAV